MEQRLSLVTLGVADLPRARRFYVEGCGWEPAFETAEVVFFQLPAIVLALWRREALLADAGLPADTPAAGAIALAHNVRHREEVEPLLARAAAAGGRVLRPAMEQPWGGLSGYFADPDGFTWEVAWNPDWSFDAEGGVRIRG